VQLNTEQILDIIRKKTSELIENTIADLSSEKILSDKLTLVNDSGHKFTILGFGDNLITVEPASGDEPFDVSFEELKKNYMLPKDASNDDEQINGDKENEE
jgi:hypothetical protein